MTDDSNHEVEVLKAAGFREAEPGEAITVAEYGEPFRLVETPITIQVVASLDDPDLDLSKAWMIAFRPVSEDERVDVSDWQAVGYTSDIPDAFRRQP